MGIELAKAFVSVRGDASNLAADIRNQTAGIEGVVGGLAARLSGLLAGAGIGFGVFKSLSAASEFEQTTIAFDTMLGSAEKTKDTLQRLTEFAAKTPFEMPEILQAARGLIQFGESGDELMDTLNLLGNAASGTSTNFGMVALIFNQIRGVGKLLTQDFRQLSSRGILSLQDIAAHFKITTSEAQNMLSEGKVSFYDLRDILAGLSAEGGRFANLMEKQSQSLGGLWSTFKDNLGLVSRELGMALSPAAKDFTLQMNYMAESIRGWIPGAVSGFQAWSQAISQTGRAVIALAAAWAAVTAAAKAASIATAVWKAVTLGGVKSMFGTFLATAVGTIVYGEMTVAIEEAEKAVAEAKKKIAAAGAGDGTGGGEGKGKPRTQEPSAGATKALRDLEKESGYAQIQLDALANGTIPALAEQAATLAKQLDEIKSKDVVPDGMEADLFSAQENLAEINQVLEEAKTKFSMESGLHLAQKELELIKTVGPQAAAALMEVERGMEDLRQKGMEGNEALAGFVRAMAETNLQKGFAQQLWDANEVLTQVRDNMSQAEIAVRRFQQAGASPEQAGMLQGLMEETERWREHWKGISKEAGLALKEAMRTPLEEYQAEMERINKLLVEGHIDPVTAARARQKAGEKLSGDDKWTETRMGFLDFGRKIQDMMLRRNEQELQRQMVNEQKIANERLAGIERGVNRNNGGGAGLWGQN